MKRNTILVTVVLASAVFAGAVSAGDIRAEQRTGAQKGTAAVVQKKNGAPQKSVKAQSGEKTRAVGGNNQDTAGTLTSISKKQHDTSKKIIENLK